MPKISVIIPVYKVGKYIENSMISVSKQTFKDFEVVLVDNNTPDDSIEIAESILRQNNLVYRVVKQTKQGLPAARNMGIKESKGVWCVSIDPDDTISSHFLEELYICATTNGLEVVFSKYAEVTEKDLFSFPQELEKDRIEFYDQKAILPLLLNRKMPLMISNTFFKKEFFERNNFKFDEDVVMGADLIQMWDILLSVPQIAFINKCLYNHFFRPDSIITAPSAIKVTSNKEGYERLRERMINKYKVEENFADLVYARSVFASVSTSSMFGNYKVFKSNYQLVYTRDVYEILKVFPQRMIRLMNTIVHYSPKFFHLINKTLRQQNTFIWRMIAKLIYK